LIWGVNQSDLAVFVGSVLTVVGVAFFAQWSLLSNITSSIIIFFNHPVKLNDSIIILEGKDYGIEGKIIDIGLFFVKLETKESGEITLPNNVFILKSIKNITNEKKSGTNNVESIE
jgi:small-conductance mechanosensitive channel